MRKCKGSVLVWITWCVLTLCMALSVASSAKADMGPKPNVTIKFKNLPDTRFVIALLTKGDDEYNREDKREYLKGKIDPYDPDDLMYQKIYQYEVDGWFYEIRQGSGGMAGTIHYIVKEILIILVECLLYAFFMKQKNRKKLRIILYAVVANLVSMVTSLYVGGSLGIRVLFFGFMIVAYIVVLIIFLRNKKREEKDACCEEGHYE